MRVLLVLVFLVGTALSAVLIPRAPVPDSAARGEQVAVRPRGSAPDGEDPPTLTGRELRSAPPDEPVVASSPAPPPRHFATAGDPARTPVPAPLAQELGGGGAHTSAGAPPRARHRVGVLSEDERRALAPTLSTPRLVEHLRDDDVKWNATAAAEELSERLRDPRQALDTRRLLEHSLHASDGQERRFATGLLQAHTLSARSGPAPYSPPGALLDATADHLDRWSPGLHPSWVRDDVDDEKSARLALAFMDRMEERLVHRLEGSSSGQGFIHAYLLARAGRTRHVDLVAPILVEHLRDNWTRDDALMSLEALHTLGEPAAPWLRSALAGATGQQRDCLELLLLELAGPAATAEEREERERLNRVTWKFANPVGSWHYLEPDREHPPGD